MQMLKKVNRDNILVSTEMTEECLVQIHHSKAASDKACRDHEGPRKIMVSLH